MSRTLMLERVSTSQSKASESVSRFSKVRYGLPLLAAAVLASPAQADLLGLSLGASTWYTGITGDISSGGGDFQLEDELGFDDGFNFSAFAMFENPIPLIPNVRVQYSAVDQDGTGTVTAKFFDGVAINGRTSNSLQLNQADAIVFWELLDTVVHIDFGLQAKFVDGKITIREKDGTANRVEEEFKAVIPMLYGGAGLNLPLTGLSAYASVAGIGYSGNSIVDANLALNYELNMVDVTVGWRELQIKLDDVDNVDADMTLGGPFLGVGLSF
ncbi:TIGR04219 family outer membrane beta-barrel protein [Allohahella sp. A8]|uniref:TIGR04219 family outer membrane beta-barrel protein n=1 Tax=Allohahella sp. A8 TaxID=3141461 RepID=UPI003A80FCC3